ncbi:SARP family transcriptional regulator [Phytohabitans aurantiacus]|uniref:SARP family transcriptional regulator n=1 Tax=Phytohabitans aurantiacus TaxID=3016789 RepID=A0ABQ5R5J7_9ACTN|nr:SARP family transcriptional regulator [Phytohabitans aurantiacus]
MLGPVELTGPDGTTALAGGPRDLLCVLALRAGETVSRALLREAGREPSTLDRDAAVLSSALARCGLRGSLEVRPAGYRLVTRQIDVRRFQSAVRRAQACRRGGDLAGAVRLYDRALVLWRGPEPLAEARVSGWAGAEVRRLRESRTVALEDRWDCALRLARAAVRASGAPVADREAVAAGIAAAADAIDAIPVLEEAVEAHPLRERRWELLLVATFLSGRRREALAVFERARQTFLDQLGVEPGERLRALAGAAERGDLAEADPDQVRPATMTPVRAAHLATLPVPLTSLLGRDALLDALAGWLRDRRLVTLVGPGGAGKTRLAIAAARQVRGPVPWFVELSSVESPVRVAGAVAEALGLRQETSGDAVDAIVDEIGHQDLLLVLDNCEHLLAGCAELVARLLRRCSRLRILATSRAALRVPDELVVPVPPLLPEAAARLFLERAQARSGRPVAEGSAGAVAQLCAELDGLPLAIELAAARTPLLSVPEIVARLRSDLRLLHSPDPTVPDRHRTVSATVESSLRQLDPATQAYFDRLAVFAGFDASAAEAARQAMAAEAPGTDALATLVGASLVERTGDRYRMLVPIRRHALDRLARDGGETAARRVHAAHYLAVAESADSQLRGSGQELGLARLRADAANLRAAMAWLAESGAAAVPHGDLRLSTALAMACRIGGQYREALGWLSAALVRHPDAPAPLRAAAGADAAMLAMLLCDYATAADYAEEARSAYRATGNRRAEARVVMTLGSVARERAQYAISAAHLDAATATCVECGDELGEARAVLLRGFTAWLAGDLERAESRLRACRRWFERLDDPEQAATALMNLGAVALYRGDIDRAGSLLDAALERYAALGFPEGLGWAHNLRGLVELRIGRIDRAEAHLALSLATHREVGDRWRTASVLEALAEVHRTGDPRRAARLLGAAARIRAEIGAPVPACERADLAVTTAGVRAALGGAFDALYAEARTLPLDEALVPRALV